MGKEKEDQKPSLDDSLESRTKIKYAGTNQRRLYIKGLVENFNLCFKKMRAQKKVDGSDKYDAVYMQNLSDASVLVGLDDIARDPWNVTDGSTLGVELRSKLPVKAVKDIPARRRYIALTELYNFTLEHPEFNTAKNRELIELSMQTVFAEIGPEIKKISECLPPEAALDDFLEHVYSAYKDITEKKKEKANEEHLYFGQLAGAILDSARNTPDLVRESKKFGLNASWRLKLGAVIFFMSKINDWEFILRSPEGNDDFFDLCSRVNKLRLMDQGVSYESLSTLKCYLNSPEFRRKIEGFGCKTYKKDENLLDPIDGKLEKQAKVLEYALKSLEGAGASNFPSLTITLALLGAFALFPIGFGIGSAAGATWAQTDTLRPVVQALTGTTRHLMRAGLGESAQNMAYKASELITGSILSCGLGLVCQSAAGAVGAAAGAGVGATADFSIDLINKLRTHYGQDPSHVKDDDVALALALINSPPSVVEPVLKDRLTFLTMGMWGQKPTVAAAGQSAAPAQPHEQAAHNTL